MNHALFFGAHALREQPFSDKQTIDQEIDKLGALHFAPSHTLNLSAPCFVSIASLL